MNRKTITALFSLAFLAIFTTLATPAHADPHAVFYTDRAQEQLFYNVLAALNQADYVEPGVGTSPYGRNKLVADRNNAAQIQSSQAGAPSPIPYASPNPVEAATHTNLPSVVSRSITLEGNDLWTAYQLQQFALEVDTRRVSSELIRIFCANGIGLVGCNTNPGAEQTKNATNPLMLQDYVNGPNTTLNSAMASGTTSQEDKNAELTGTGPADASNPANVPGSVEPNLPRSAIFPQTNSAPISALRDNNVNDNKALGIIDNITSTILAANYNSILDPNVFSNITFTTDRNNNTTAQIKDGLSLDEYMGTIAALTNLVPGIQQEARNAQEQGRLFQQLQQNTPSLAQYVLTKDENGGVKGTITVPSSQVAEQANQAIALLGNGTLAQKYANANEIQNPGSTTVLTNQKLNVPSVEGISTTDPSPAPSTQSAGQVAGIADFTQKINDNTRAYYDSPAGTAVNTNPTSLGPTFDEPGPQQVVQAISGSNRLDSAQSTTCGYCANIDIIIGNTTSAGKAVLTAYQDTICYFFPTVGGCVAKNKQ